MLRRFAGWLMRFFPDEPRRRPPFSCNVGFHEPAIRDDIYGQYLGCALCDWADTLPTE
jgi:hypothetical protein